MKPGKPPECRHILQHERKLIASEKDVQGCFMVKAIIQREAHDPVLLLNHLLVIRTIHCADKVQPVGGIGRNFDQAFGLVARLLISSNHVKVNHCPGCSQRTHGMRRQVKRSQKPALLGRKHHEQNGALGPCGIGRKRLSQANHAYGSGTIVVGAMPYLLSTLAIMIMMAADDDGLPVTEGPLPSSSAPT